MRRTLHELYWLHAYVRPLYTWENPAATLSERLIDIVNSPAFTHYAIISHEDTPGVYRLLRQGVVRRKYLSTQLLVPRENWPQYDTYETAFAAAIMRLNTY